MRILRIIGVAPVLAGAVGWLDRRANSGGNLLQANQKPLYSEPKGFKEVGLPRMMSAAAAAWILSLGFDLLLHGGLLARLYVEPSPFLLEPVEAFRRIPLGYLAFLILTLSLYWLVRRLGVRGAVAGMKLGFGAGAVGWGAFVIGLYSISTATWPLLAGWWGGQAAELGLAGAVLGAAEDGVSLKRIWVFVAVTTVVCVGATILLQSLGLAPAMKVVNP